ncbi:MAG TPA: ATP-binding protein [Candidatus Bilamarchaeaceae archaeon]|nr:ATP-binding protein [Candidatus Bilamarchaeaceae archaeon]
MEIGTVISIEGSPSTSQFSFVVNKQAKKGQYIQTENEEGIVFGYIAEVTRANRYFERPDIVKEYEHLRENFPVDSWEHLIGEVKILGTYDNGKFLRTSVPPNPGAKVELANKDLLKKFLGFSDKGIMIGNIQHHDVEARVDMTRLLNKHLAILAMSGSGKSYLTSIIIEELLDRKPEEGRIAVVLVDIHGEYIGFKHDEEYGSKTNIIEGKEIAIPLKRLGPESIEQWVTLSEPQKHVLRSAMAELKKEEKNYNMKQLIEKLDEPEPSKDTVKNVKKPLIRSLGDLRRLRLFSKQKENPIISEEIQPGKLSIFDFSTIESLRKKQIIVSYFARALFSLRKKGKIPPFVLIIEEAHNFAREKAERSQAISRAIIESIAREGRKFGASLCLITQRPVNLSTTALSQCNSHIILRITNPNDLKHIEMSSEGIDSRVSKSITALRVGEAIIVGEAVNYPLFVSVRKRKSTKRERGKPLHEQAIEYEKEKLKKEKDVEAFL